MWNSSSQGPNKSVNDKLVYEYLYSFQINLNTPSKETAFFHIPTGLRSILKIRTHSSQRDLTCLMMKLQRPSTSSYPSSLAPACVWGISLPCWRWRPSSPASWDSSTLRWFLAQLIGLPQKIASLCVRPRLLCLMYPSYHKLHRLQDTKEVMQERHGIQWPYNNTRRALVYCPILHNTLYITEYMH